MMSSPRRAEMVIVLGAVNVDCSHHERRSVDNAEPVVAAQCNQVIANGNRKGVGVSGRINGGQQDFVLAQGPVALQPIAQHRSHRTSSALVLVRTMTLSFGAARRASCQASASASTVGFNPSWNSINPRLLYASSAALASPRANACGASCAQISRWR